jgi:putative hemolysin
VFYEEGAARADAVAAATGMDCDPFDAICDHLIVVDCAGKALVGTYRLLRQEVAEAHDGFYSAREFDLEPLIERHRHLSFLELGRSCVLRPYRTKAVIELLWQGIWDYVRRHRLDVMVGCASLEGTDPRRSGAAHELSRRAMRRAGGLAGGGAERPACPRCAAAGLRPSMPGQR